MTYERTLAYTLASDFLCRWSEVDKVHTGTCMIDVVSQFETRGDVENAQIHAAAGELPFASSWGEIKAAG